MAKRRHKTGREAQTTPAGEAESGAEQGGGGGDATAQESAHSAVTVDRYIDVDRTMAASGARHTKFGPRAIDSGLVFAPEGGGMNVAVMLIESIQNHLEKARRLLADMGGYAGDLNIGEWLLTEFAVMLGAENLGNDDESRQRGQPIGVPWGHVLAVRGLLGHFSPALEDRSDWPEPVIATRGLTCADILLGPLPTEFGYTRSINLLDWARHAVANPPTDAGFDSTTVEEEFYKPYRLTVLTAVRFHLARLIAWVDGRIGAFEDLVVPVLTLTGAGVEVRVAGAKQVRSLGDLVEPFLTALLDEGRAKAVAKTKFDLVAKVPELRPFIAVVSKRDKAGLTMYRLAAVVRRKAGHV